MKKLFLGALLLLFFVACVGCSGLGASTLAPSQTTPSSAGAAVPPLNSTAYDGTVGGVHLALRTDHVEVVGAVEAAASLSIPAAYQNLPVTVIAAGSLTDALATSLHIPASVTEIADGAFGGALTSITVAAENPSYASKDGILYNKDMTAFVFTPHVVGAVEIPQGIVHITKTTGVRYNGLEWSDGITTLTLPASLRTVSGSFRSLCSVSVSSASTTFTSLDGILYKKGAAPSFAIVPPLLSGDITILDGVTSIPASLFADPSEQGNTRIRSVILPVSLGTISENAFLGCRGLASINFPAQLTVISKGAFDGCALTEVTLPASITKVEKDAFDCEKLKTLVIANGASGVSGFAFRYHAGQYIRMTASSALISEMGRGAIDNMGSSDFDAHYYSTLDMVETLVFSAGATVGENTAQLRALREIVFPSEMTKIADMAFAGCISLRKVVIPQGVTQIGARAFNGCPNLAAVTLPSTLKTIGTYAFARTAIVSLTLPASITSFGARAFAAIDCIVEVYNLANADIFKNEGAEDPFSLGACAEFVYTSAQTPSKVTTDADGYIRYNGEAVGYVGDRRVLDEQ